MNLEINGRNYAISIAFFWGSHKHSVMSSVDNRRNGQIITPDKIMSLEVISTLTNPFIYGSFVFSDDKKHSELQNLIDMPLLYANISFVMLKGSDIQGAEEEIKPIGDEYFVENVFITGIETVDSENEDKINVKFNFASEDIENFNSNIFEVTTFNKKNGNQLTLSANDVIKKLFGSAGLTEKLDIKSFETGNDTMIKYINSKNDNLLSSLDYVYRKMYDDSFDKWNSISEYTRIRYNHTTHKYEQWKYSDIGTGKLLKETSDEIENRLRNIVTVDSGSKVEPNTGRGKFRFGCSGSKMAFIEEEGMTYFTDYDYTNNKFKTKGNGIQLNSFLKRETTDVDTTMIMKDSGKGKIEKYKHINDIYFSKDYTTSNENGSPYDNATNFIFNSDFYRIESDGSIGRKAGDEIILQFANPFLSMYENAGGSYVITAMRNVFERYGDDGKPSFKSIMDTHKPFIVSDDNKTKEF